MAKPRSNTPASELLENGIDYKNRVIYFGCSYSDLEEDEGINEINERTVRQTVLAIRIMVTQAPKTPISIYMNSGGGSSDAAWSLIDVMLTSPCQFKFYGNGIIGSAAVGIMLVSDERYLTPRTKILIHDSSWNDGYSQGAMKRIAMEMYEKEHKEYVELYSDNSLLSFDFYDKVFRSGKDLWITATEAVEIGMADEIIPYTKRGNLRKKRNYRFLKKKPSSRKLAKTCNSFFSRIELPVNISEVMIHTPAIDESDPNIIIEELTDTEGSDSVKERSNNETL